MNVVEAIKIARLTDVGLYREHNEDAVASDLSIGLMVLADGMGGYKAGEIASEIAVLSLMAEMSEAMQAEHTIHQTVDLLAKAIVNANDVIHKISQEQPQCAGMGTTLATGVFNDNKLIAAHVGDSRIYRLRKGVLTQLTEDHSLLQEQINMGLISKEQARHSEHKNLVTRALGIDAEVEISIQIHDVEVDDIYLICSDGLTDMVEDREILAVMADPVLRLEKMASKLVKLANDAGGKDNTSVILAQVRSQFAGKQGLGAKWVKKLLVGRKH